MITTHLKKILNTSLRLYELCSVNAHELSDKAHCSLLHCLSHKQLQDDKVQFRNAFRWKNQFRIEKKQ